MGRGMVVRVKAKAGPSGSFDFARDDAFISLRMDGNFGQSVGAET